MKEYKKIDIITDFIIIVLMASVIVLLLFGSPLHTVCGSQACVKIGAKHA